MTVQEAAITLRLADDDLKHLSADGIRKLISIKRCNLKHCTKFDAEKLGLKIEALKVLLLEAR